MNKKNIAPTPQKPVARTQTGQLPSLLAELEEGSLDAAQALPSGGDGIVQCIVCSYSGDGDD